MNIDQPGGSTRSVFRAFQGVFSQAQESPRPELQGSGTGGESDSVRYQGDLPRWDYNECVRAFSSAPSDKSLITTARNEIEKTRSVDELGDTATTFYKEAAERKVLPQVCEGVQEVINNRNNVYGARGDHRFAELEKLFLAALDHST